MSLAEQSPLMQCFCLKAGEYSVAIHEMDDHLLLRPDDGISIEDLVEKATTLALGYKKPVLFEWNGLNIYIPSIECVDGFEHAYNSVIEQCQAQVLPQPQAPVDHNGAGEWMGFSIPAHRNA